MEAVREFACLLKVGFKSYKDKRERVKGGCWQGKRLCCVGRKNLL